MSRGPRSRSPVVWSSMQRQDAVEVPLCSGGRGGALIWAGGLEVLRIGSTHPPALVGTNLDKDSPEETASPSGGCRRPVPSGPPLPAVQIWNGRSLLQVPFDNRSLLSKNQQHSLGGGRHPGLGPTSGKNLYYGFYM